MGWLVIPLVFLARMNGFAVDRLRVPAFGAVDRRRERRAAAWRAQHFTLVLVAIAALVARTRSSISITAATQSRKA